MPISVFLGAPRALVGGSPALRFASRHPLGLARAFSLARPGVGTATAALRSCGQCSGVKRRRERADMSLRMLSTSIVRQADPKPQDPEGQKSDKPTQTELHESPYTIPNALTLVRIASCPVLAWSIVQGNYELATGILVAGGATDWLDGYLARKWNQKSVLGSILDPMADKTLMTTLVVCLTYQGLLPLPLAILIFGRDLALSLWAFYLRFISLPPPRTLKRYFDVSMPSAEVQPTQISKINTALQLLLMGVTTVSPLLTAFPAVATGLHALQWTVAGTTIWSGLSYIGASGFKILKQPGSKKPKPPQA